MLYKKPRELDRWVSTHTRGFFIFNSLIALFFIALLTYNSSTLREKFWIYPEENFQQLELRAQSVAEELSEISTYNMDRLGSKFSSRHGFGSVILQMDMYTDNYTIIRTMNKPIFAAYIFFIFSCASILLTAFFRIVLFVILEFLYFLCYIFHKLVTKAT